MSNAPQGNEPWMMVVRLLVGLCGLFIAVKFLSQIPSGSLELVLGDNDLPDLSYTYRASTPPALFAAAIGFGGMSLGFLLFAVYPKALFRPDWVVPWAILTAGALVMLKQLAQFTGIVSSG